MKFTPDVLKNRLIDSLESARGSSAPPRAAEPREAAPPATEVPNELAGYSADILGAAEQPPEAASAAPDWAAALAADFSSLASSVEHLSRRCDFMIECFRRWQSDLHVDLVHQRMKMTEIGSGLLDRIAAAESRLSGKLDTVAGEMRIRQEGIEAALEAHAGAGKDRVAAAESLLSTKLDTVAGEMQIRQEGMAVALEAHTGPAKAALDQIAAAGDLLRDKLDAVAEDIRVRQEGIEAALEAHAGAGKDRVAAAESLLSTKLDTVAGEMQIRQEGMAVALEAHTGPAKTALDRIAAAGDLLRDKLDAVAEDIRVRQEGMEAALETHAGAGMATVRVAEAESLLSTKLDLLAGDIATRHDAIQAMLGRPVLAGHDLLITKVDDFILAVPRMDWILAAHYVFWGTLEHGMTRYLTTVLQPGMVFVDVGANIGIHTLHAARAVGAAGMVHSFEPSPETFRVLEANARANGFEHVALYPLAVLDRSGEAQLHQVPGMCGWNSLFAPADSATSVPVKATTLDEALANAGRIDVVKIDAEGAEPFIWRGMRGILEENARIRIVIEFAPIHLRRAGVRPEDFLAEISAAGFAASRIEDDSGDLAPFDPAMLTPTGGANLLLERPAA